MFVRLSVVVVAFFGKNADDISKEKCIYNASRMSMAKKKKAKNKYCKVTQLT